MTFLYRYLIDGFSIIVTLLLAPPPQISLLYQQAPLYFHVFCIGCMYVFVWHLCACSCVSCV